MIVDKEGGMVPTKCKRGMCVKSDHDIWKLKINMTFHAGKDYDKIKMFNLRNKLCRDDFRGGNT